LAVYGNEEVKMATVVVPDYQLSLAIGKEGQNARLAAKLTGWKVDIKNETQFMEEAAINTEEADIDVEEAEIDIEETDIDVEEAEIDGQDS